MSKSINTSLFSQAQHHSQLLYLLSLSSPGHHFFLSYFSSAPGLSPSHGRQCSKNFSSMSLSQRLQFSMSCSSLGPLWGHRPCQQLQRGLSQGHSFPATGTLPATPTTPNYCDPQSVHLIIFWKAFLFLF